MVLDPNQTSAPTQNDQTIGSLQNNDPNSPNSTNQHYPVRRAIPAQNSVNSIYGNYQTQEIAPQQEAHLYENPLMYNEKIQPEAVTSIETTPKIKEINNPHDHTENPPLQPINTIVKPVNVENHKSAVVADHAVSPNADKITTFADEDEKEYIKGIVQHHANN